MQNQILWLWRFKTIFQNQKQKMPDNTLILKPNKIILVFLILFFTVFFLLLAIILYAYIIIIPFWPVACFFGVMALVNFIAILFFIAQIFTPLGSLFLNEQGIKIYTLSQGFILHPWHEIKEFQLFKMQGRGLSLKSTVILITAKNKRISLCQGNTFPLSEANLLKLLRNWHAHFTQDQPIENYDAYKRQGFLNGTNLISVAGIMLFSLVVFAFTKLLFFPTSSFIFQNTSDGPILDISVKSSEAIKTTFKSIPQLKPGETIRAILKGMGRGSIDLTFTQNHQTICKHFYKSKCLWDDDIFTFQENRIIEARTNTPHDRNCTTHISQYSCY